MDLRKIVWQRLDPEARERPGFSSANMGWRAKDASRMWRWERSTRSLLLWAFVVGAVVSSGPSAAQTETPADFIRVLGNRGLEVIRAPTSISFKATYFRQMLQEDFDLPGMCRFALGRYYRISSHHKRREFCHLFAEDLLRFYGTRLSQYSGEGFVVTGSRPDPAGLIVTSQIVRPQGPPVELDWRLVIRNGYYRVSDVVVEGVSMAVTKRSEIAAIIERNGGQFNGLLATIRARL
jgi:phospholipid transport system substrate-binding protein